MRKPLLRLHRSMPAMQRPSDVKFGPLGMALRDEISDRPARFRLAGAGPILGVAVCKHGFTAGRITQPRDRQVLLRQRSPHPSAPTGHLLPRPKSSSSATPLARGTRRSCASSPSIRTVRLQTINETMASCVFAQDAIYRKGASPAARAARTARSTSSTPSGPTPSSSRTHTTDDRVQGSRAT